MKKSAVLLLLIINVAAAQVTTTGIEVISTPARNNREQCNLTTSFINQAKLLINEQMNTSPYLFTNLTSSYCYDTHVNLNFLFKKEADSYTGKRVSVSLSIYDEYDYDLIFTNQENDVLDWTLKQKYISYLINRTDEEYYVRISSDNCEKLRQYYDELPDEKYFNQEYNYCNIVLKTNTKDVKGLVDERVNYINYFGNDLRFTFSGYSRGDYNLESISNSINCELTTANYYYPEFETDCYGIYKDKGRLYFSVNNKGIYLTVHAIIGGKARFYASAYGENISQGEAQEWINQVLNNYFPGSTLELNNEGDEYTVYQAEKIVNSFNFNNDAISDFSIRKQEMNTYYSDNNTQVIISEPYIQVYVPSTNTATSDELRIVPYYWGHYFIITENAVYSSINLEENNETLAIQKIKEFINPYLSTNDWELNMSVTGGWYYPLPLYRESGLDIAEGAVPSQELSSISDPLANEFPEFEELETEEAAPTTLELIINFFKNLFRS